MMNRQKTSAQAAPASFKSRSTERMSQADHAGIRQVRAALERARIDAETESTGLARRVGAYYQRAADALDQAGSFEDRDADEERFISQSEQMAASSRARLAAIQSHSEVFSRMLAELDAMETHITR